MLRWRFTHVLKAAPSPCLWPIPYPPHSKRTCHAHVSFRGLYQRPTNNGGRGRKRAGRAAAAAGSCEEQKEQLAPPPLASRQRRVLHGRPRHTPRDINKLSARGDGAKRSLFSTLCAARRMDRRHQHGVRQAGPPSRPLTHTAKEARGRRGRRRGAIHTQTISEGGGQHKAGQGRRERARRRRGARPAQH